jgi:hypothetical protein
MQEEAWLRKERRGEFFDCGWFRALGPEDIGIRAGSSEFPPPGAQHLASLHALFPCSTKTRHQERFLQGLKDDQEGLMTR